MFHHTKNKGDVAVSVVISEFTKANCYCLLPISEHLPFDLVVYDQDCIIGKRIQVKYRSIDNDCIKLALKSHYQDRGVCYSVKHDLTKIDTYVIYCGDNNKCYYLNTSEIHNISNITIRIDIPKNLQFNGTLFAPPLEDPLRIFRSYDQLEQEKDKFLDEVKAYVRENYSQFAGNNTQYKPVSREELQRMLQSSTPVDIAKQFNIHPATVRRWCREYNLTPTRNGLW